MSVAPLNRRKRFRLWLVQYGDAWQPQQWDEQPPDGRYVSPIEGKLPFADIDGCVSTEQAAAFRQAFNEAMLGRGKRTWVVAIPVTLSYAQEPRPGGQIS